MARVTVDDCISKIENPFDLTLIAAKRAYQIAQGSKAKLPIENDKPVVLALREIAENVSTKESIEEEARALNELRDIPAYQNENNHE